MRVAGHLRCIQRRGPGTAGKIHSDIFAAAFRAFGLGFAGTADIAAPQVRHGAVLAVAAAVAEDPFFACLLFSRHDGPASVTAARRRAPDGDGHEGREYVPTVRSGHPACVQRAVFPGLGHGVGRRRGAGQHATTLGSTGLADAQFPICFEFKAVLVAGLGHDAAQAGRGGDGRRPGIALGDAEMQDAGLRVVVAAGGGDVFLGCAHCGCAKKSGCNK